MRLRRLARALALLVAVAPAPLLGLACERSTPGDPSSAAPPQATTPGIPMPVEATEEVEKAREIDLVRRTVSGLDPGELAPDFKVVDAAEAGGTCLMCTEREAAKPMVIAFGAANDRDFHEDVADIDAIVAKWGFDRIAAVAVVVDVLGGEKPGPELGSSAPADDADTALSKLRSRLDVEVRVVRPASEQPSQGDHPITAYHLTRGRTLIVLAPDRRVVYSTVAPDHFRDFDRALASLVEPKREASE